MTYNDDPIQKVVRGPESRDKLIRNAYERIIEELSKEYETALDNLLKKHNITIIHNSREMRKVLKSIKKDLNNLFSK